MNNPKPKIYNNDIKVLGRVVSIATENKLAAAEQVFDEKFQYSELPRYSFDNDNIDITKEGLNQYSINRLLGKKIKKVEDAGLIPGEDGKLHNIKIEGLTVTGGANIDELTVNNNITAGGKITANEIEAINKIKTKDLEVINRADITNLYVNGSNINQIIEDKLNKPSMVVIAGPTKVAKDGSVTLHAEVLPTTITNRNVYWQSLTPSIATVDVNTGVVTAGSQTGVDAKIRAYSQRDNSVFGEHFIYVYDNTPVIPGPEEPTIQQWTVTFVNGSTIRTVTVDDGDPVSRPTDSTTIQGYKFIDWEKDNSAYDFNAPVTSNITITAHYEPYELELSDDSISLNSPSDTSAAGYNLQIVDFNENATELYTWSISSQIVDNRDIVTDKRVIDNLVVSEDGYSVNFKALHKGTATITCTGVDSGITRSCTVTVINDIKRNVVYKDGNNVIYTVPVEVGTTIPEVERPTKEGWIFYGWEGIPVGRTMPDNELTIQSMWTRMWTATFNANGGSPTPEAQTLQEGESVVIPTEPTKSGFVFAGWCVGTEDGELYDFNLAVYSNLTLVAKWTRAEEYSLRLSTQSITFDENSNMYALISAVQNENMPENLSWVSSDPSLAMFSADPGANGKAGRIVCTAPEGTQTTVTITCSGVISGKSATCTVTINIPAHEEPIETHTFVIEPSSKTMTVGDTFTFTAKLDGTTTNDVIWDYIDDALECVTLTGNDGTIEAYQEGTVQIKAHYTGSVENVPDATLTITIINREEPPISDVTMTAQDVTLRNGQTNWIGMYKVDSTDIQVNPEGLPQGVSISDESWPTEMTCTINDESIATATVTQTSSFPLHFWKVNITGVSDGTTTASLTATTPTGTYSCTFNITILKVFEGIEDDGTTTVDIFGNATGYYDPNNGTVGNIAALPQGEPNGDFNTKIQSVDLPATDGEGIQYIRDNIQVSDNWLTATIPDGELFVVINADPWTDKINELKSSAEYKDNIDEGETPVINGFYDVDSVYDKSGESRTATITLTAPDGSQLEIPVKQLAIYGAACDTGSETHLSLNATSMNIWDSVDWYGPNGTVLSEGTNENRYFRNLEVTRTDGNPAFAVLNPASSVQGIEGLPSVIVANLTNSNNVYNSEYVKLYTTNIDNTTDY